MVQMGMPDWLAGDLVLSCRSGWLAEEIGVPDVKTVTGKRPMSIERFVPVHRRACPAAEWSVGGVLC